MNLPTIGLGSGFALRGVLTEASSKAKGTKTSTIGGKRIKERKGKLSGDLGKPAFKASAGELDSYVASGKTPKERQKRNARVNLMRAHKKGHKAQAHKVSKESVISSLLPHITFRQLPTLAVVESRLPRPNRGGRRR